MSEKKLVVPNSLGLGALRALQAVYGLQQSHIASGRNFELGLNAIVRELAEWADATLRDLERGSGDSA